MEEPWDGILDEVLNQVPAPKLGELR